MWTNPQFSADLGTFAEEILNGKLYFLMENFISCSKDQIFRSNYGRLIHNIYMNKKSIVWNLL